MQWRCVECGQTYDEAPERCSCGSAAVEPADGTKRGRLSLRSAGERLLSPNRTDRSLIRDEPYVDFAFRVLLGLLLLGAVFVAVAIFL